MPGRLKKTSSPAGTVETSRHFQPSLRDSFAIPSDTRRSNAGLFSKCPGGTQPRSISEMCDGRWAGKGRQGNAALDEKLSRVKNFRAPWSAYAGKVHFGISLIDSIIFLAVSTSFENVSLFSTIPLIRRMHPFSGSRMSFLNCLPTCPSSVDRVGCS
jgi:hypothetical protein